MFCLPKNIVDAFIGKLKSGEITPEKLSDMTSKQRRDYLAEFMGEENAKKSNALFESKLLLKDQQRGIITWAKQLTGIKPQVRRDIIARVNKMTEVLTPENEAAFLEDLVAHKLGTTVTMKEAADIAEFARTTEEKRITMESGQRRKPGGKATETEMDYGRAYVRFMNYIKELKNPKMTMAEYKRQPVQAASRVAGIAKSIKASMDNSAIFRQGWKTLWTHNRIWRRNAIKSFRDIWDTFGGKRVMDEVQADIVSRPNYELMKKAKLATGTIEEEYPGIPEFAEKIPIAGKAYKASENAFTAFVYRTRADVFDKYIEIAKKSDIDLADKVEIESIGKLTNSLTGRGYLGRLEPAANVVNNVFFSPRFLKSQIDTLLLHPTDKMSFFARKQAAINLLKIVSGTTAILVIANAVKPDSVEWDPRSADFGKIRIGNTRFDVTGGMGSVIVLAARLIRGSTKSSVTGKIRKLSTDEYGAMTGMDVIYNFFENKLSPAYSVIKDILKGKDFEGNKPTILGEIGNLFVPISIETIKESITEPNSANVLLTVIADALGIGANTYGLDPREQTIRDLIEKKRLGYNITKEMYNAFYNGEITRADMKRINREGSISEFVADFKDLSLDEASKAYIKMDAKDRRKVFSVLRDKYNRKIKAALPAEKPEIRKQWEEIRNLER